MVPYESEGLFVGLISYPFNVDGADLFHTVLKKLFEQHKEYLQDLTTVKRDDQLYKPAAYRMFGSHGLAILSLMDEYAFGSRIFNPSHVELDGEEADLYPYKCVSLTGSSDQFLENGPYLADRANKTFLRENDRFPFIGLIRIKLECRLLLGHGNDTIRAVKKRIEKLKGALIDKTAGRSPKARLEIIIVDSYDSDELLVAAFANSFRMLDSFFKDIRRMKTEHLEGIIWENDEISRNQHACTACHMSYGYDMSFFTSGESGRFLAWDKAYDQDRDTVEWLYCVQCIVEPNPGHQAVLCDELETAPFQLPFSPHCEKTVTGGSVVKFRIQIEEIEKLHETVRQAGGIQGHIRRIKLVLEARRDFGGSHPAQKEFGNLQETPLIPYAKKEEMKVLLRSLGISKITRERALALVDLTNDCGRNPLQQIYFALLKPAVENLVNLLDDFLNPDPDLPQEDILHIEERINAEINALESAIYNRMYNKMTPNAVLEYGGGIQQFLQAFGHAFRELVRVFCPEMADRQYLIISGAVKEFSNRTHTELNINHFLYPQLFCLTTWKEASNYTIQVLDKYVNLEMASDKTKKESYAFAMFRLLLTSDKALFELKQLILGSISLHRNDPIYWQFDRIMDHTFLRYALHDYIVYHFAFQRDFELMWRVNWKAFLQTSSCYSQRGIVHRTDFIYLMLRLLMVAFREKDAKRKKDIDTFLLRVQSNPPDPLLLPLWMECFDKLKQIAGCTCTALTAYRFQEVGDTTIKYSDDVFLKNGDDDTTSSYLAHCVAKASMKDDDDLKEVLLEARKARIRKIIKGLEDRTLTFADFQEQNPATPDIVICLMSALLRVVDGIDRRPASIRIIATPRDEQGEIQFKTIQSLPHLISGITADPIGGFLIPDPKNREKFFVYRTIFYRTLWDLSYRSLKEKRRNNA